MSRIETRWSDCLLIGFLFFLMAAAVFAAGGESHWQVVADGLDLGRFKVNEATVAGDSTIVIVRVDPAHWELRLLAVGENGEPGGFTAREWASKYKLVAVTNAGMFLQDHRTHVGFMKSGDHVNSRKKNKYKSAAAFSPLRDSLPLFRIFDLDVDKFDSVVAHYASVVQNLRMIDRAGENRWSRQADRWSEAALGEDRQGRALLIFSRSPYTVHDLNRILLSLPIDLVCAQHLEGGPEAQLYLHWGTTELELTGSYETAFTPDDFNQTAWPVPNVIGITPKE
jgi:hypothetical protein